MPRIRSIKPEHWNDKELANLSLPAHLLWIGMWNFSDDEGVIEADPLLIRSQVFPRRTDISVEQIDEWLGQLVKAKFVIWFDFKGSSYYIHRTFKTHQKVEKAKPSKIPKELIENVLKHGIEESPTHPRLIPDSSPTHPLVVGAGEERRGEEKEGRGECATPPPSDFLGIVIYDAEKEILENQILFEQICVKTGKDPTTAKGVLRKYHLYLLEKEQYPKGKKAVFAGFEKWLMNEKNQKNGTSVKGVNQTQPVPRIVTETGTRNF